MSTQAPPHMACPAPQTHVPPLQLAPDGQTFPQAPQLVVVVMSTQAPPHMACPAPQTHVPPLQLAPDGQTFPQAPQLAASEAVSTQVAPQAVSPDGHWQVPAVHESPSQ